MCCCGARGKAARAGTRLQARRQRIPLEAILGALGGAGGGIGSKFGLAASAACSARAQRYRHLGPDGAVFSRGQRALMTGAVSGAALLEGAVDEAAMPLTRTRSGDLGVRVEGGAGTTIQNTFVAERLDPGTVSTLFNLQQRATPTRSRDQCLDPRHVARRPATAVVSAASFWRKVAIAANLLFVENGCPGCL